MGSGVCTLEVCHLCIFIYCVIHIYVLSYFVNNLIMYSLCLCLYSLSIKVLISIAYGQSTIIYFLVIKQRDFFLIKQHGKISNTH